MRGSRRASALLGGLLIAGSLVSVTAGGSTQAGATEATATYVVLAADAATVDATIADVQAAGGTVERVNRDIGLITVSSSDTAFATTMNGKSDVAGVARDTPIGSVPSAGTEHRDTTEKEGHHTTGKQPKKKGPGKPGAAEPLASYQWDMRMIDATPTGSYRKQPGRKDVLVGVIDTGIDGTHPDIAPNFDQNLSRNFTTDIPLIDGPCEDEADGSCTDANNVDEDGHGTHVAGTIASPINGLGIAGVAPNVTLVNLRAGQDSGYFFLGPTVDALTYAGNNGIDVVNMSFYVDPWLYNCRANPADSPAEQAEQSTIIDAVQRALNFARRRGVTLISALGNENTDLGAAIKDDETSPDFPPGTERSRSVDNGCIDVPAESDGVISVSSVGPSTKKADYSNYGNEQNDVAAPGGFYRDFVGTPQFSTPENLILGPYPKNVALAVGDVDPVTGESLTPFVIAECSSPGIANCAYYQLIQGTSMAAPHAVGVAALIVSQFGDRDKHGGGRTMDPKQVEKILLRSATDVRCPAPVISYAAEGRPATYDAACIGGAKQNSIYGEGIVNAKRAVD